MRPITNMVCCLAGAAGLLLSAGCSTIINPITVRPVPSEWNEVRAFEMVNAMPLADAEFDALWQWRDGAANNPRLYAALKDAPHITKEGVLWIENEILSKENLGYALRTNFKLKRFARIPVTAITAVKLEQEIWGIATPTYTLTVELMGELPFRWKRTYGDSDNKRLANLTKLAEAFEWLRLNGTSAPGVISAEERNIRRLTGESIPGWTPRVTSGASPFAAPQMTITLQSDGKADFGAALAGFLAEAGRNAKPLPPALLETAAKAGMAEKAALDAVQKAVFVEGASIAFVNPTAFGGATVKEVSRRGFTLTLNPKDGKSAALTHAVDFADVKSLKLRTDKDGKENGIVLLNGTAPLFAFSFSSDKERDGLLAALKTLCGNLQAAGESPAASALRKKLKELDDLKASGILSEEEDDIPRYQASSSRGVQSASGVSMPSRTDSAMPGMEPRYRDSWMAFQSSKEMSMAEAVPDEIATGACAAATSSIRLGSRTRASSAVNVAVMSHLAFNVHSIAQAARRAQAKRNIRFSTLNDSHRLSTKKNTHYGTLKGIKR